MTLEEAIKRYKKHSECIQQTLITKEEAMNVYEWLRELKDYKDARVGCEYCKHKYREQHERPCSLCQRNFMDMFEKEVNADDNNNHS